MKLLIGNFKGPKGEQGNEGKKGDNGDKGEKGERGSRWTSGTAITGTSTTETIFADSGITDAKIDDYYINTTTGNLYQCTASGAADTAKWVYIGNFKGPKGNDGPAGSISDINDQIPTYEESTQFENIESGETVKIAFGKLKKALSVFIVHHTQKATAAIIGHVKLSNSAAITKAGEYALDAIEKNAAIEGTLANLINSLNSNLSLKDLSTNNYIDVLTNIGQITSIGFWKIANIDGSYAQSIGITPNNNTGDFYAIVSNYNGDGVNHFHFGNLQLYSPRLGTNYFTVQVWNEVARAECMIIHSNVLNTMEQVSACTESPFVAGALAAKAMMADYNNKINQINSNMACKKIEVESNFASEIKVWRIGNVVSVDIDGYIIAPVNTIFATGFPIPIFVIWVQDLAGHHFRLYNGNLKCNMELNGKEYTNLHFTYLCV